MDDSVRQAYEQIHGLAKDYFGIGDSEADTLLKVARICARQGGIPLAGVGAVGMAGVGAVALPIIGSVPGWVAGALGGFIGGTTACIISHRALAEQVKQVLSRNQKSEAQFKAEVARVIKQATPVIRSCS